MKHEHTLEVTVPAELQEKVDRARDHLQNNKKVYLFGLGGIVVGVIGARTFSRPPVMQTVVVHTTVD